MKFTVLIVALMIATSAFANRSRVEQRIQNQLQAIESELPFSRASVEELRDALRLIRQAKRIVFSEVNPGPIPPTPPAPPFPPVPSTRLECIDRDNDNRAPYVLSYVDGNFNVIKLRDVTFASMQNCQRSLNESFFSQGVQTMCVARDGDNRAPYSLVTIEGTQLRKITIKTFSTYQKCREIEVRGLTRPDGIIFCIDRDSDNRAPYVIRRFSALNASIEDVNSQTFSSMSACESVLFR